MKTAWQKNLRRRPVTGLGIFFFCATIVFFFRPEDTSNGKNVAPDLFADPDGHENGGDDGNVEVLTEPGGTIRWYARGGSTDKPGAKQGKPPWRKTGNARYIWYVKGMDMLASVNDGDTTTEPSMVVYLDDDGSVDIQASFQEEYRDSSPVPITIYWPQ